MFHTTFWTPGDRLWQNWEAQYVLSHPVFYQELEVMKRGNIRTSARRVRQRLLCYCPWCCLTALEIPYEASRCQREKQSLSFSLILYDIDLQRHNIFPSQYVIPLLLILFMSSILPDTALSSVYSKHWLFIKMSTILFKATFSTWVLLSGTIKNKCSGIWKT